MTRIYSYFLHHSYLHHYATLQTQWKIEQLNNPDQLKKKRAGYRSQITRQKGEVDSRIKLYTSELLTDDLEENVEDIERLGAILYKIQERLKEIDYMEDETEATTSLYFHDTYIKVLLYKASEKSRH